ncbi:MAG: nucleotidyl transferase AbiEii/AbiGii toxin family protein [Pseudomonadota bacterium]
MIPKAFIVAWRQFAPWISDAQVEQDLIMSRAIVALFENRIVSKTAAFRGGTALHKLYFKPARRYSEDVDLVQITSGAIGPLSDAIQESLTPFLGVPRRKQTEGAFTLTYRMDSEGPPVVPMKLKIEINTREHFAVTGIQKKSFTVESRWFSGGSKITTFNLEELLCTKVRALYQRRKGRDLFDLWLGLTEGQAKPITIVKVFDHYMKSEGHRILKRDFEKNLKEKMEHPGFLRDLNGLLPADVHYDIHEAYALVLKEIINRLSK